VVKAMFTPIMVTPVILAFAFIISFYFIPEYEKIAPPSTWPGIGKVLYAISILLRGYGIFILAGLIASIVVFVKSFGMWSGALRAKFDEYLPYKLYRDYNGAKFLVALASLVNSKATLVEALEILSTQCTPWMLWHIQTILANMDDFPDDYARAFNTGILSKEIHLSLSTYARRSSFSDGLVRLGTEGLQYVHESVEKSSTKLNIAAIFGTVFVIMFFYGGNLMISQSIQKTMKAQATKVSYLEIKKQAVDSVQQA
jgi:toxin co-regulated pilus biosynthesis protein E